jgi:diguanylate cyclase (GGDEF)-like protein/PAS domain S-box-containing protein
MNQIVYCLTAEHDLRLVLVAGLVSFLSAAVGYDLLARARVERRIFWLASAALVTGSGIWATHFIAVLAYDPGVVIGYGIVTTALSGIAGTVISGIGFAAIIYGQKDRTLAPLAGVVIGGGVAVLHYVGIAALIIPGSIQWNWVLVLWSVGLGCALGAASTYLFQRSTTVGQRLVAALLLTLAVCSHHFTSMGAITIVPGDAPNVTASLPKGWLVVAIVAAMVVILLLAAIGGTFDRMLASRELREARRLSALANAAFEGIVLCRDGKIVDANESFRRLIGIELDEMRGRAFSSFVSEGDQYLVANAMNHNVAKAFTVELRTAAGVAVPAEVLKRVSDALVTGDSILAVRDLRERKEAESRIRFLAHHDALTGLANRAFFSLRFDDEIARAQRAGTLLAIHYVDLDRFKAVNDSYGHGIGDEVLKETAKRLDELAESGYVVARLGGDEFVIVQVGLGHPGDAVAFAEKVCTRLNEPLLRAGDNPVAMGASVGVAVFPHDGRNAETLAHSADVALYRAKEAGRATYRAFEPGMADELRYRRALQQDLRTAVATGALEVYYQPQVRVSDGGLLGFEALARWRHPEQGFISPATFIPLAEESSLILQLGEWVLRTACMEAAGWQKPLSVAVNLSSVQIIQGDLPRLVQAILLETGLDPTRLELEVTESVLIKDTDRALHVLRRLKALGIRIAMDDFGTGYSSLSYLQSFPFDKLKIDRSFIQSVDRNAHSRAIVRAVVGLGRALDLPVVAEGVETTAQLEVLRIEDCEEVQGYLTGRPMSTAALETFLASNEQDYPRRTKETMAG